MSHDQIGAIRANQRLSDRRADAIAAHVNLLGAIACALEQMKYTGIELDPMFHQLAVDRVLREADQAA